MENKINDSRGVWRDYEATASSLLGEQMAKPKSPPSGSGQEEQLAFERALASFSRNEVSSSVCVV